LKTLIKTCVSDLYVGMSVCPVKAVDISVSSQPAHLCSKLTDSYKNDVHGWWVWHDWQTFA